MQTNQITIIMKKIVLFLFVPALVLSSCGYIGGKKVRGNGNWKTTERNFSSFNKIEVRGAIDVFITQGDFKPVKIETDENLQEYVEIREEGNTLIIETKSGYNLDPTQDMKVHVTAPVYKEIQASGACDIVSESKINNAEAISFGVSGAGEIKVELSAPKVDVDLTGAGSVIMAGETKDFSLELSGAGHAKCFDLKTENTDVSISGAGDAEVFASVNLTGSISGAGSIKYKGGAKHSVSTSGAGSVSKVD
jgi:hypothetical protein